jgi:hypothetical protein
MPRPAKHASDDWRRALRLLADAPDGHTEVIMVMAHGFSPALIAGLIKAELVSAHRERAGRQKIEVVRLRITDKGRLAL